MKHHSELSRIAQRVRCAFGLHHRSHRATDHGSMVTVSICRGCRAPMIKDFGGWRLRD